MLEQVAPSSALIVLVRLCDHPVSVKKIYSSYLQLLWCWRLKNKVTLKSCSSLWYVGLGSWAHISRFSEHWVAGWWQCWDKTKRDGLWISGNIYRQDGSVHQETEIITLLARSASWAVWACQIRADETAWCRSQGAYSLHLLQWFVCQTTVSAFVICALLYIIYCQSACLS